MRYINTPNYDHKQNDKIGILLTNLGTPDEPTPKALKRYLKQFLSDPRVVEVPRLLWWLILNCVILQIRPRRSAKAYATVFTEKARRCCLIRKHKVMLLPLSCSSKVCRMW